MTETATKNETNIELKLKRVRLSFDNLFVAQEQKNDKGEPSWSHNCVFLLDKVAQADQVKMIQEAMVKARDAKWPGVKKTIQPERRCLRDGEPADPDTGERAPLYDGYNGMMYLSAKRSVKSKDAPNPVTLIGPRKGSDGKFPRLKESDGLLYGGCYVNAIVRIYAFDGSKNGYPDRINCSLEAIQHCAHGEPFGAKRVDADTAFDEEAGEDEMGGAAASDDLLG